MKVSFQFFLFNYFLFTFSLISPVWSIPFKGSEILISGPSPWAIETGTRIAKAGGNVVDVAVASILTLAVTSPYYASLGGGGFALVKMNSQPVEALDFREVAPKGMGPDFYKDPSKVSSTKGGSAVGVPGLPAGLFELHKKYGKLSWYSLFNESFKLAKKGFEVSGEWVENTQQMVDVFDSGGVKHFLSKDKSVLKPGQVFHQWPLSRAIMALRDKKLNGFYRGPVAHDIIESSKKSGSVMTMEDLASYKVRWLVPMMVNFKDHNIYLMPPPSSGGVVIQSAIELAKRVGLEKYPPLSVDEFHLIGEILSRSFKSRSLLGDPDFTKNPIDQILNAENLNKLAKTIQMNRSVDLEAPVMTPVPKESIETTHLAVLDKNGNSVSITVTLNGNYGSGVVTDQFGIALNNEMDDFTTQLNQPNLYGLIQGESNQVAAGKRPLSSMSPTLVEKDGQIVIAMGAPGGSRIISGVFQGLYRVLVTQLDMDQAIQTPRVHHQYRPHQLLLDRDRFSPETIKGLKEKGHQIEFIKAIAKVYGIRRNANGILEGAFDSRGEGAVGGY